LYAGESAADLSSSRASSEGPRHSLGFKAPRGWGWLTNPKRAAYNRIYNRTTVGCAVPIVAAIVVTIGAMLL